MHHNNTVLFNTGKFAGTITAAAVFSFILSFILNKFQSNIPSFLEILFIVIIVYAAVRWGKRRKWL